MSVDFKNISGEQRTVALQRLTALWAFSESGLGGILHALRIPFTGLVLGGLAVIIICLIAEISDRDYKQILKSTVIVLLVKAMVSPYTPFPAYIAVSFQALLGFTLFSISSVNVFSILLFSTISMIESAIQKLLLLTLFFGKSLWVATDELVGFITKQFGIAELNGSRWIIAVYLTIYFLGGLFIAWVALKTIKGKYQTEEKYALNISAVQLEEKHDPGIKKKKTFLIKIWSLVLILLAISIVLFVFSSDNKTGWQAVLKSISWTMSIILIWFMLIGPLFTKFMQKVLHKKEGKYKDEIFRTLSFLPVLKELTQFAWKQSKQFKKSERWYFFISVFVRWSFTYVEQTTDSQQT